LAKKDSKTEAHAAEWEKLYEELIKAANK